MTTKSSKTVESYYLRQESHGLDIIRHFRVIRPDPQQDATRVDLEEMVNGRFTANTCSMTLAAARQLWQQLLGPEGYSVYEPNRNSGMIYTTLAPVSPVMGSIWIDTNLSTAWVYNGAEWQSCETNRSTK